jgi:hypothetical protein
MIELAFVLTAVAAYLLGFYHRVVWNKIKALESNVITKIKAKEEPESESTFLDPDDVIQRARFEQAEIQRKLNTDA